MIRCQIPCESQCKFCQPELSTTDLIMPFMNISLCWTSDLFLRKPNWLIQFVTLSTIWTPYMETINNTCVDMSSVQQQAWCLSTAHL